ncbi:MULTISPECIES: LamG domain-containing protein [unclassified Proteiniphilum]|uniref:LamG domain-containing protein n=1 Tax=unclassified Proteiniphilum TaxID=2622718 RepID=UPI00257C73B0|nr:MULTISPECIES: LamG domain-containing protein [unclassified Proteiniphilum]
MKKTGYILLVSLSILMVSCFQDLGQNPPFDYPEQPTPPPIGSDGQIFYMSFDKDYEDYQSLMEASVVGTPSLAEGKKGKAYAGAKDSYLKFGINNMAAPLKNEMTFGFWYKVNSTPDRAGILVISPKDEGQPANNQINRSSGIRIFRENASGKQRIKANIGNGTDDSWLDGADKADIDPASTDWKYISLVLTKGKAFLYIDTEEVATANLSEISWKGCDFMSIGSGAPYFNGWGHLSDNSLIDELRIFNKALTAEEIAFVMAK